MLKDEREIILAIQQDRWMMGILAAGKTLDLTDWWICAGFVRSKIWDVLHGYSSRTAIADIDVIYFDEKRLESQVAESGGAIVDPFGLQKQRTAGYEN